MIRRHRFALPVYTEGKRRQSAAALLLGDIGPSSKPHWWTCLLELAFGPQRSHECPVCPPTQGVVMRKSSSKRPSVVATPRARNNTENSGSALQEARVQKPKLKTTKKPRSARNAEMAAPLGQAPGGEKRNDQPANIGSAEDKQQNESRRRTYSRMPRSAPATRTANASKTLGRTRREQRAGYGPNGPTAERAGRRHPDLCPHSSGTRLGRYGDGARPERATSGHDDFVADSTRLADRYSGHY